MIVPFTQTTVTTMSSREIAELVESRHDNVRITIERLANKGIFPLPATQEKPTGGRPSLEYHLDKRSSLIVVAQLCPEFTARIVDRWQQLEEQAAIGFTIPQNLPDALRLAADLADENAKLKAQLDAKPLQINNTTSLRAADLLSKTVRALYDGGMPRPVALGLALEEVHRQTGVRMLPDYEPPKMPDPAPDRLTKLIKYVQKSKRYITHSQLLKKMHLTAADFKPLVAQAIESGHIASRPGTEFGFGGVVYTLAGGAA